MYTRECFSVFFPFFPFFLSFRLCAHVANCLFLLFFVPKKRVIDSSEKEACSAKLFACAKNLFACSENLFAYSEKLFAWKNDEVDYLDSMCFSKAPKEKS